MPRFKFGDMVTISDDEGIYMVVGPYIGERLKNDPEGPAVWVADIDTMYMKDADGGTVWAAESQLEPADWSLLMTDWSFTVPGPPPSINATYKVVTMKKDGVTTRRLAKTAEAAAWQLGVAYIVKTARPTGWVAGRRVRIEMKFWMNRAGRDADNPQKALLDGIAAGLGVNDSAFLPCVISNEVDKANPRVEVTIRND